MKINPGASLNLFACTLLTLAIASCESPKKDDAQIQSTPTPQKPAEEIVYLKQIEVPPPPAMDLAVISPSYAPAPVAIQAVQKDKRELSARRAKADFIAPPPPNTENYQHKEESPIKVVAKEPVSTFSVDVDTGAYANVRRFLKQGQLPPKDAVRIEELINYFPYANTSKKGEHPFGVDTEIAPAPWNADHQLLRVRIQALEAKTVILPPANLVFLVDVSGSMESADKPRGGLCKSSPYLTLAGSFVAIFVAAHINF